MAEIIAPPADDRTSLRDAVAEHADVPISTKFFHPYRPSRVRFRESAGVHGSDPAVCLHGSLAASRLTNPVPDGGCSEVEEHPGERGGEELLILRSTALRSATAKVR